MEREKLRFLSLTCKDQPGHASRVTEGYKMLDCIWGHPSSRPPGSPKQICLGVYPGCTSTSPERLKISPTLHLPSPNPARLPGGPEPLDGPVSVSRPGEGSIRSSTRVERQETRQLTPEDTMQRWREAWVELGEGTGGEGVRLGSSMELFVWGLGCSSCLAARAVTVKDISLTAPKSNCWVREETAGGTHIPASARAPPRFKVIFSHFKEKHASYDH